MVTGPPQLTTGGWQVTNPPGGGPRFQRFDSLAFWLLLLVLGLILSTKGRRWGKPPPAGFAAWLPLAGRLLQLGYSLQGQNARCSLRGAAGSTSTFPGHRICSDLLDDNHGREQSAEELSSKPSSSLPTRSYFRRHPSPHSGKRGSFFPLPSRRAAPEGGSVRRGEQSLFSLPLRPPEGGKHQLRDQTVAKQQHLRV